MSDFAISFLLLLSSVFGIEQTPKKTVDWATINEWHQVDNLYYYKANSETISTKCVNNEGFIRFPQVIHGVHKIYVDGKLALSSGDETFKTTSSFYNRAILSCKYVSKNSKIEWEIVAYSKYFARFDEFPRYISTSGVSHFYDEIIYLLSCGGLMLLSLFSIYIFRNRTLSTYYYSLAAGSVSWAIYSAMVVGPYFSISTSMLLTHKIADFFVWTGCYAYFYHFYKTEIISKSIFRLYFGSFIIGLSVIIVGETGDVVQLGTTIPMFPSFLCFSAITIKTFKTALKNKFSRLTFQQFLSGLGFTLAGCNDITYIFGINKGYMILPLGALSGIFFLAASISEEIAKTYQERDTLLVDLEMKVQEKTKHLSEALLNLKKSQADLVQSARLASLGTLSAGIAHEINNSINYVNGALIPLERKVMKHIPESEAGMYKKLFSAIKEGTQLTVDIVKSLRSYTGMNQAKIKEVSINEVILSVLTILKSRLKNINVEIDVSNGLTIWGHQVGINQILMNLLTNAADAINSENGKITIKSYKSNSDTVIEVSDNGMGMSTEVIERIFDPFYTTKEIGHGTGLGMHIVKQEVNRHRGQINVNSEIGKGTTFKITLPNLSMSDSSKLEAA